MNVWKRFINKVEFTENCWNWTASLDSHGYGSFWDGKRNVKACNWLYEQLFYTTKGLVKDHLCRNRRCVNPLHLREVTHKENILCGEGLAAQNARKTHCRKGHPFNKENTRIDRRGKRICLSCYSNWKEVYNATRRKGTKHRCSAQTHCKYGHEFTKENITITKQGWRRCNICMKRNNDNRKRR